MTFALPNLLTYSRIVAVPVVVVLMLVGVDTLQGLTLLPAAIIL